MVISNPPDWEQKLLGSKTYAKAMIVLGVFLAISGLFFLIFLGVNWAEITGRGLEGAFMRLIVFSAFSLFFGTFSILQNWKRLKRTSLKEQGLSEVERKTPFFDRFAFLFAIICLYVTIGLFTNNVGYYIAGIGFILLAVNEFLIRTSKRYKDSVGRVSRQIIGVTAAASVAIYYAFVSVNLLVAYIGFAIIIAYFGFVLFTRYRKKPALA